VHGELVVSEGELVEPLTSLLVDLETSWFSSHIPPCVQVHGELVVSEGELVEPLTSLLVDLESSWSSLQSDLDTTLCLTNFCKSSFL
jgi:hypothetical protein